jgi:hypothetical protein
MNTDKKSCEGNCAKIDTCNLYISGGGHVCKDWQRNPSVNPIVRRWKFRVEDPDGEGCYVGPDGKQDSECEWIGTDADASKEAQRRSDAWENATHGLCLRVVYESQGQVKANMSGSRAQSVSCNRWFGRR